MYPRVLDSFLLFFRLLLCNSCNLQYFVSNLTVCSVSVCIMQAPCDDIFVDYFFTLDCGRKTAPEYKNTKSTIWAQQGHKMNSESTKQTLWSHSEHKKDSNHCTLYILALSGGRTVFFMMSPFHSGVTMFFSDTISFSWALPCFFQMAPCFPF